MDPESLKCVLMEAHELAKKKNNDYGSAPMLKFREKGIAIRLYDKTSRLSNLLVENTERKVDDETIEDTCLDIINYAAYIIMLRRETFKED